MAVLSDPDRAKVTTGLMRYLDFGSAPNTLKTDLRAAVNAADVWIDTNSSSFAAALPATFRTNSNATQKVILFICVLLMRYNVELLKRIVGEVD